MGEGYHSPAQKSVKLPKQGMHITVQMLGEGHSVPLPITAWLIDAAETGEQGKHQVWPTLLFAHSAKFLTEF